MLNKLSQQKCNVCGTHNPPQARFCNNCGTALTESDVKATSKSSHLYDSRHGERDLIESDSNWRGGLYVFSILALFLIGGGILLILLSTRSTQSAEATPTMLTSPNNNQAAPMTPEITNTPRPTRQLMTVTQAPPTATPTPTEGPCQRQVAANDTLIGIISSCGHRDLDVLNEVLELNNLSDASALSLGQIIEVPRPTPTPNPNAIQENPSEDTNNEDTSSLGFASVLFADGADGLPTFTPTIPPTLPPGIQFHQIQKDETIIHIVNRYSAGVEVLSQLNPEITFSQCEFNDSLMPYGGPSCTVMLFEGMQIRVPAPTPTPTLSPTPSGSETATPSPSPTFNAPSLISPGHRTLFRSGDLVTLRWRGTGTLGTNEAYLITVTDLTTGLQYRMQIQEDFLILPREWQGKDGRRHEYQWQVSVINQNTPDTPKFVTETRLFTWEALPPSEEG